MKYDECISYEIHSDKMVEELDMLVQIFMD